MLLFLAPIQLIAGTWRWWQARVMRVTGGAAIARPLSVYRLGRQLQQAYEQHYAVRVLVDHLSNYLPLKRTYLYYRGALRRTVEFRNVWSRGVIGGFVARSFPGEQPPTSHGSRHSPLQGADVKIALRPQRRRRPPPYVRGAARYRARHRRSGLGV